MVVGLTNPARLPLGMSIIQGALLLAQRLVTEAHTSSSAAITIASPRMSASDNQRRQGAAGNRWSDGVFVDSDAADPSRLCQSVSARQEKVGQWSNVAEITVGG